ncbi:DUF1702 family protein [Chloroflexi bacterium TSY]|nr:DUF1702 family protein [Chloroflexi bacterium TSY]
MVQKLGTESQNEAVIQSEVETVEGDDGSETLDDEAEQLLAKLDTFSNEELVALLADELQPGDITENINVDSVIPQIGQNGPDSSQTNLNPDRVQDRPSAANQFDDTSLQSPRVQSIIDQVYATLSGRELPMEQQVDHRTPLDTDPVTTEGKVHQQIHGMPSGAAILQFRHVNDTLPQLRHVYLRFVGGCHAALDTPDPDHLWQRIQRVEDEFRDFAIEGVGTGYATLDLVTSGDHLNRWLNGPAAAYLDIVYIGVGIALARQQVPLEPYIAELDPIMRWKIVDGYGFTFGMFNWEEGIDKLHFPSYLSEEARHAYYQGLGRSLWMACCGEGSDIAKIISRFPLMYHGDIWSGAAYCSTMTGGVERESLEQFRTLGQHHLPAIAQGAAFATQTRGCSGSFLPWNELACQVYWQMSAQDVSAIAQETLRVAKQRHVTEGENPYQAWRTHIQQIFAEREPSLISRTAQ